MVGVISRYPYSNDLNSVMSTFFRFISVLCVLAGLTACVLLLAVEQLSLFTSPLVEVGILFGSGVWAVFFWAFADLVENVRRLNTLLAPPSLDVGFSDRDQSDEEESSPFLEARWTLTERTKNRVE